MSFIGRAADSLLNWISPYRTVKRRKKPFKTPRTELPLKGKPKGRIAGSGNADHGRRSTTPNGHTARWETSKTPSDIIPSIEQTAPYSISSRKRVSNGTASSPAQENDTSFLEDDSHDVMADAREIVNDDRDPESRLKAATGIFILDLQQKIAEQRAQRQQMLDEGWDIDTVHLYLLIARRGFEQLFPQDWREDFPFWPGNIFTTKSEDAYLGHMYGSSLAAVRQIEKMKDLGIRMRLSVDHHTTLARRPEGLVETTVRNYIKWSYKDAKLTREVRKKRILPLIEFVSQQPGVRVNQLETIMLKKLRRLAKKQLAILKVENPEPLEYEDEVSPYFFHGTNAYIYKPPTLYGIVTAGVVVAVVAYEPSSTRDALRTIGFFQYSKPQYDVWNSLALAILVLFCRDHMLRIQKLLPDFETDTTEEEDVDL